MSDIMRTICKSCPAHNNMSAYHCKGDDENCSEVMRYDDGYESGFNDAIGKASEWLKNNFEGGNYVQDWQIEEFVKAMNGE